MCETLVTEYNEDIDPVIIYELKAGPDVAFYEKVRARRGGRNAIRLDGTERPQMSRTRGHRSAIGFLVVTVG